MRVLSEILKGWGFASQNGPWLQHLLLVLVPEGRDSGRQEVNSEVSLFEAVLQLFHATDPAVVLGYAGKPGARCVDKWGGQWVKHCGKHEKTLESQE